MKAIFLYICLCFAPVSSFAMEDPYGAALALLPQEHSHTNSNVTPMTLDQAEQTAQQANPEIRVAARKVAMTEAHVSGAGALDDPSVMYRGWQVPLTKPWDYNAAMSMFMVGQSFPGPGKRALRSLVAGDAITVEKAELEAKRREIAAAVRKTFYDLLRAGDELQVHDEQVAIARQAFEAARIKYSVGKVPQQDVLKAQLALTKLVEHLVMLEQDADLSRTDLNTLLGRSPDSPLEVAGKHDAVTEIPTFAQLQQLALESRPELIASAAAMKQAQDETALARKQYTPDFSVSAGYMLTPSGSQFRNNYMIEGSMTLPWLNRRKHESEISEARSVVAERESELDAIRFDVFRQIQEAVVRANGAKRLVEFYEKSLRPQAEATLHSTLIAYENDRTDILNLLDSQNTTLDVDYAHFRALAEFEQRMAELELAVGAPIPRSEPIATVSPEVTR